MPTRRRPSKVKVPYYGNVNRSALIEDGATVGATIGLNLYGPDGDVLTVAQLAALLSTSTSSSSGDSLGGLAVTLWRLIREVPIYTNSPVSPTWEYTLDGAPIGNVGFAAIADALATGSLAGDLVLQPVSGRVFTHSDIWINVDGASVPTAAVNADARLVIADNVSHSIELVKASDTSASLGIRAIAAGGTYAAPTAITVANSSYIGYLGGSGHDGVTWQTASAGLIGIRPVDTWSGSQRPTRVTIETTGLASTTRVVTASFDPAEIELNATLLDVNATLDVVGTLPHRLTDSNLLPSLPMNGASSILLNAGGGSAGSAFALIQRYNNAGGGPDIGMYHSRSATVGTHTILSSNDEVGSISFYASDGTATPVKVARIIGFMNGTPTVSDLPSRLDFLTTAVGAVVPSRVLRLSNALAQIDATELEFNGTTFDVNATSADFSGTLSTGGVNGRGNPGIGTNGDITVSKTSASLYLEDAAAAANETLWRFTNITGQLNVQTRTDANLAGTNALAFTRSGTTVTEIEFNATLFDFNGNLDVSGTSTLTGAVTFLASFDIQAANSFFFMTETGVTANNGTWLFQANGEQLILQLSNDAKNSFATWLLVNRTANVVDEVEINATLLDFNGDADISLSLRVGTAAGTANPLILVGRDTTGDNYISFMESNGSTRKGYVGYGNVGDDVFYIANEENASVLIQTNATTRITVAGTGAVTFAVSAAVTINSTLDVAGVATFSAASTVFTSTLPILRLFETDAASDEKNWLITSSAGDLTIATATDASPTAGVAGPFVLRRTGTTVDEVELNAVLFDFNGNEDLSGSLLWSGVVTPSTLAAGDNDNVNLGVGSVIRARIAGNATTSNLTSVTGGSDGKLLILTNVSANTIMIINEDTGGTAANRFAINGDMVLPQNCSALFIYDGNIQRWTRLN